MRQRLNAFQPGLRFLSITAAALAVLSITVRADFLLKQEVKMGTGEDSFTVQRSIWVKDARERSETRMQMEGMDFSAFMPQIGEIRQCDLQQTIRFNDKSKRYYIEPFPPAENVPLPAAQPSRTTVKVREGGILALTYTIVDTGERRQMFGFTARHLKTTQTIESGRDACDGEQRTVITEDGWFIYLIPENAKCDIDLPPEGRPQSECRNKLVRKGTLRYPGTMIEGKRTIADLIKKTEFVSEVRTLELSRATLPISLFEAPAGYTEVNSMQSLLSGGGFGGGLGGAYDTGSGGAAPGKGTIAKKTVAIDFFAGNVSKINQNEMRQYLASKIESPGIVAIPITSQTDLTGGGFAYVIGVKINSVKESGASKIGGLFGKITGSPDASKIGESEADLTITIFGPDGKSPVASASSQQRVNGKADAAVRAALDAAFAQISARIK